MTLEPARRLELDHRKGIIKEGADGDVTIFDPDTITDGRLMMISAYPTEV